jgi:hypothetical protein
MDQYRKKLRSRILWLSALTLFAALFGIYDVFFASDILKNSMVFEFQGGLLAGICLLTTINTIRYNNILKDDRRLKLEFNKENDERIKAIKSKAGLPLLLILSVLMIVSAIIAGYFNATIFYTLIIAAVCQALISFLIKLFYMKKM